MKRILFRLTAGRPRLSGSLLGGLVLYAILPGALSQPARMTVAWDSAILTFLALTIVMAASATPAEMKWRAQYQDANKWVILGLTVVAALAGLLSIGLILPDAKHQPDLLGRALVALAGLTILLSWIFAHIMFALHYAHEFYGNPPGGSAGKADKPAPSHRGGLAFPEEKTPDYWDFFYFSFVVGMTCQVSDVQVTSRPMRRLTLGHGLVSFLFNTVILALSINIAAGLLQ
ncbi:MAG: hypothetical protein JWL84_52 [Rhodospirillales bacterium]|nr:hypothetical protein [Rhodospirillales bacterium]